MHPMRSAVKASRAAKLSSLGLSGRREGKSYDVGGKAFGGHPLLTSDEKAAKRGGAVEGEKGKGRLDRVARASGGAVKGKGRTNINIIVAPGGGADQQSQPQKIPVPIPVPQQGPAAMPPMGLGGVGAPMGAPAMGGMPPSPMLPRKRGGRVDLGMTAEALSGKRRLQKTEVQKRAESRR